MIKLFLRSTSIQGLGACRHACQRTADWCTTHAALQGYQLFSQDLSAFLVPQSDGNVVLYNTSIVNQRGYVAAAAMWASNTYSTSPVNPYKLIMQTVGAPAAALPCCCNCGFGQADQSSAAWAYHSVLIDCRIATLSCTMARAPHCTALEPTMKVLEVVPPKLCPHADCKWGTGISV